VQHVFSPNVVTKFDLLKLISDAYSLDLEIVPVKAGVGCYRSLSSCFNDKIYDTFGILDLKEQILEQRDFRLL